ncbi:hypothetical protein RRG08_035629 [Elysia crispata]|uniref:C2H2-type domain-containing protein n=1 Tax=Elysia crispata TaxID=231223 RepID=A0AAE0YAD5_9GAST|nr:hypothetical protein RRG08_035629 [Elysia crispata]
MTWRDKGINPFVTGEVLNVVEEACLPFFLLLFERFRFFARSQNSSETASDFAQSLQEQIKLCQFNELQESLLISAFISGIADDRLRQKLLKINSISFDDAVNMCDTASSTEQVIDSADLSLMASTTVKKGRGRKRKKEVNIQQDEKDKLYIMPVDNDDHEDVYLDDAKLVINKFKITSKRKKEKPSNKMSLSKGQIQPKFFKCFACSNEYCTRKSFRRHVKAKHADIRKFYCVHCNMKFETRKECFTHCRGHKLNFSAQGKSQQGRSKAVHDTSYICWHCGETQANLADYKEHCAKHSAAVRVYTCDICQKKNHNICRLIGHLKGSYLCLMVIVPRHKCEICGNCFGRPELLVAHMQTHADQPSHQCKECREKLYLQRPVAMSHAHTFRFISNLNRHRKGHTGKRLYVCQVCGRSFIYNEGLRDHIKAGRCPGMKSETGGGGKISYRGPRPRNSNAVVSMSMMNVTMDGSPSITVAPQPVQVQPEYSSSYMAKSMLNPVNLSIQVSAPSQHARSQQHVNQLAGTVTCSLPEYVSEFTTWPQYMIRNNATVAEGSEVGQLGTNVVIVPQFY